MHKRALIVQIHYRWLFFGIFIGAIFTTGSTRSDDSRLFAANAPGAIGEVGSLYLNSQGIYILPLTNDAVGQTDKLLTAGMTIGGLISRADHLSSIEIKGCWRLFTPSFKRRVQEYPLNYPLTGPLPGRFADWIEIESAFATSIPISDGFFWKHQLSLGFGHFGDHGGREFQIDLHNRLGDWVWHLTYEGHPDGYAGSAGYETSLIFPSSFLRKISSGAMVSLGVSYNKMMLEEYIKIDFESKLGENVSSIVELKFILQNHSDLIEKIDTHRFEAAFGFQFFRRINFTTKYV